MENNELKEIINGEVFFYDPENNIYFYNVDKFNMEETEVQSCKTKNTW